MSRRAGPPWPFLALAAVVLVSLGSGVILLGPDRAMRIAAAASAMLDGLHEGSTEHRIRVVEVDVDPASLDSLESNLPWSGDDAKAATLVDNGISYPCRFRYRGLIATTHFLGDKKSFRLTLKKDNPFAPFRRLNFINPKSFNMVNTHLALWIAGRMGVAVPYDDFVFVRLNGQDYGVMEMVEQVDGDFERTRNLVEEEVPVFKGDYPPAIGDQLETQRRLWKSAGNWQYASDADSTKALQQLAALVSVINDPKMPWPQRRDSLATLVDVDAFLRYAAALKVIDTQHIDNYHNQWLVLSPRTGLFYPVMWDPLMLFPPKGEPFYPVHDALSYWLLRDPEWRGKRDDYVYQALEEMHTDSAFYHHMDEVLDRIRPSVLADRHKTGDLSSSPNDVFSYSAGHWAMSADGLRKDIHAYWGRLLQEMQASTLKVDRKGDGLHVTGQSIGPLLVSSSGDTLVLDAARLGADQLVDTVFIKDGGGGRHPIAYRMDRMLQPDTGGIYFDEQRYMTPDRDVMLYVKMGNIDQVKVTNMYAHGKD